LEEALALHQKKEAICLELGNKGGLGASYCNQANVLYAWGLSMPQTPSGVFGGWTLQIQMGPFQV
jgi:hypothetical protein